jgi:hypothetical protein
MDVGPKAELKTVDVTEETPVYSELKVVTKELRNYGRSLLTVTKIPYDSNGT